MRYQIKQKLVSIGDDFLIRNESGENLYFVDGYGFSFGNKHSFQDMDKNQLMLIKQRLFTFSPSYKIFRQGVVAASLSRSLLAFRNVFYIDLFPSHRKLKVVGRMIEHEYKFFYEKEVVAEVSKRWFRTTDSYAVDINGFQDHQLILASAIIIDLVCHDKDSKHKR